MRWTEALVSGVDVCDDVITVIMMMNRPSETNITNASVEDSRSSGINIQQLEKV